MYLIKWQWVYIATLLMFSPKSFRKQWVLFKVIMPKVTLFILGHLQTIILDQSQPEALQQTVMDPQIQKHSLGRTRSRHCWLWTLKVMMWTLDCWYKHMTDSTFAGWTTCEHKKNVSVKSSLTSKNTMYEMLNLFGTQIWVIRISSV